MRTKISDEKLIAVLSKAFQLPTQISAMHCRAHIGQKDEVSKGSNFLIELQKLLKHDRRQI